jgi:hypothetical protein
VNGGDVLMVLRVNPAWRLNGDVEAAIVEG